MQGVLLGLNFNVGKVSLKKCTGINFLKKKKEEKINEVMSIILFGVNNIVGKICCLIILCGVLFFSFLEKRSINRADYSNFQKRQMIWCYQVAKSPTNNIP